ncbi:MAG: 4Fe-4S binding protein [Lachnospiraceae bacterium]|nr:4Fe-4S binding protein [Lachnospiraceae bacterium]
MDNKKNNHGNLRNRLSIGAVATMLQNANFKGFFTGEIYQGSVKNVCVPGLNCYSCPGAIGSCPIGSLQSFLSGFKFKFPYYVLGLLIFFGAILGRAVCAFLCPFGLLQELIYLIPFPIKINRFKGDKTLRKLKYIILILFVIVLPLCIKLTPFFCKYICPSGTVSGILLAATNSSIAKKLGTIFTWKVIVLATILIASMLIWRPFCKYLCPLGAFYSLFNPISLYRMSCDKEKCVSCGKCANICKMGVNPKVTPNSFECIRCGDCIKECPTKALFASIKQNSH